METTISIKNLISEDGTVNICIEKNYNDKWGVTCIFDDGEYEEQDWLNKLRTKKEDAEKDAMFVVQEFCSDHGYKVVK